MTSLVDACPCGSGTPYVGCCRPLHTGSAEAEGPEALMRARFAAYALGELDFVFRTWHPRTRPVDLARTEVRWTGLQIHGTGPDWVAFTASYLRGSVPGAMRERSRFERRRGRWVYVGADDLDAVGATASSTSS